MLEKPMISKVKMPIIIMTENMATMPRSEAKIFNRFPRILLMLTPTLYRITCILKSFHYTCIKFGNGTELTTGT